MQGIFKKYLQTFFFGIFCLGATAYSVDITVTPMQVTFDSKQKMNDIRVENKTTSKKAYVGITLSKVLNPGKPNQHDQKVEYSALNPLLITPSKLIVSPKGVRIARAIYMHNNTEVNEDTMYHILFKPMSGKLISLKKDDTQSKESKSIDAAVSITISYNVNAFVLATHPKYDIQVERSHKKLTLNNKGNVYTKVEHLYYCKNPLQKQTCIEEENLPIMGAFPHMQKSYTLKKDMPVRLEMTFLHKIQKPYIIYSK